MEEFDQIFDMLREGDPIRAQLVSEAVVSFGESLKKQSVRYLRFELWILSKGYGFVSGSYYPEPVFSMLVAKQNRRSKRP